MTFFKGNIWNVLKLQNKSKNHGRHHSLIKLYESNLLKNNFSDLT